MDLRAALESYELPRATGHAPGEDAARRRRKRREAIISVQCSSAYANAIKRGHTDVNRLQPDPDDVTISKRKWESACRQWRVSLRTMAGDKLSSGP